MDNYETEEQQVEAIKKWLNENYKMLVVVSIISLGSIVGVQQWKQNKALNSQTASIQYDQVLQSVMTASQGESDQKIAAGVASLQAEYADYPYAALATLLEAKELVDSGNSTAAVEKYNWVINNSQVVTLQHISRIRLATVLSSLGKNEEALKTLGSEYGRFKGSYFETQGDILVLLNRTNEAKSAYDQALQAYAEVGANAQILEVKRNDLGNS